MGLPSDAVREKRTGTATSSDAVAAPVSQVWWDRWGYWHPNRPVWRRAYYGGPYYDISYLAIGGRLPYVCGLYGYC